MVEVSSNAATEETLNHNEALAPSMSLGSSKQVIDLNQNREGKKEDRESGATEKTPQRANEEQGTLTAQKYKLESENEDIKKWLEGGLDENAYQKLTKEQQKELDNKYDSDNFFKGPEVRNKKRQAANEILRKEYQEKLAKNEQTLYDILHNKDYDNRTPEEVRKDSETQKIWDREDDRTKQMWDREDKSYQIAAADMRTAGLNPALMFGSGAGAGGGLGGTASNNNTSDSQDEKEKRERQLRREKEEREQREKNRLLFQLMAVFGMML